jgi:hypothetical protein
VPFAGVASGAGWGDNNAVEEVGTAAQGMMQHMIKRVNDWWNNDMRLLFERGDPNLPPFYKHTVTAALTNAVPLKSITCSNFTMSFISHTYTHIWPNKTVLLLE